MSVKFWEKNKFQLSNKDQGQNRHLLTWVLIGQSTTIPKNKSNGTEAQAKLTTVKKQPDNAIVYWE